MSGGSKRGALELAGVGHRITHSHRLADPRQIALIAAELGTEQLSQTAHQGAQVSALVGKTLSRTVQQQQDDGGESPKCPSPCGEILEGSPNTFVGKAQRQAATIDKYKVSCRRHRDKPIRQGSADVWINGLPVARRTDETRCGAHVGEGEPTVLVGEQSQTCSSLDMGLVQSVLHRMLDAVLGMSKRSSKRGPDAALSVGASLAQKVTHEEEVVQGKGQKLAGAGLSSDIGKQLSKGDAGGASQAVSQGLGLETAGSSQQAKQSKQSKTTEQRSKQSRSSKTTEQRATTKKAGSGASKSQGTSKRGSTERAPQQARRSSGQGTASGTPTPQAAAGAKRESAEQSAKRPKSSR